MVPFRRVILLTLVIRCYPLEQLATGGEKQCELRKDLAVFLAEAS